MELYFNAKDRTPKIDQSFVKYELKDVGAINQSFVKIRVKRRWCNKLVFFYKTVNR